MSRRVWTGIVAGVLAAGVLLTVGIGAYHAGQDHEVVTRTVTGGDQVVHVMDGRWGYGGGGWGPACLLFPLLLILGIVLLVRAGRRHWGGWGHPYAYGWGGPGGPCGPQGPGGPGGPGAPPRFEEWHRQAHEGQAGPPATSTGEPPTGVGEA